MKEMKTMCDMSVFIKCLEEKIQTLNNEPINRGNRERASDQEIPV